MCIIYQRLLMLQQLKEVETVFPWKNETIDENLFFNSFYLLFYMGVKIRPSP
jgi:hypothetical protein